MPAHRKAHQLSPPLWISIRTTRFTILRATSAASSKRQGVEASGIADLLGSALGHTGGSTLLGLANQLLDTDHDGSALDEVGGFLLGLATKKRAGTRKRTTTAKKPASAKKAATGARRPTRKS